MIAASSTERRVFYGACEPVASLAWGSPPDPGTVALSTLFRLVCFGGSWWTAAAVGSSLEVHDGGDRRAPRGAGCAQGAGDRLRARPRQGRRARAGGRAVPNDGTRAADVARLAQ